MEDTDGYEDCWERQPPSNQVVNSLENPTVDAHRSGVVRLVQEPEPTPFIAHRALVFGGDDQLFRSFDGVCRVHRNEASSVRADCNRQ